MDAQDKIGSFWAFSPEEAASIVQTDLKKGLSDQEASKRLKRYGRNSLKRKKRFPAVRLFFKQFNSPLIFILLFYAALSLILYDKTDATMILAIVAISCLLTFFQEKSAF